MSKRLVLDVDGVICDIWTGTENIVNSEGTNFSFRSDVLDFRMTNLAPILRKNILSLFAEPQIFKTALFMPCDFANIDSHNHNRVRAEAWLSLFRELRRAGTEIVLHTHVANKGCADERKAWLKAAFGSECPEIICDIGESKAVMRGDIIVDDCLKNLIQADTQIRILPVLFHNRPNALNSGLYESLNALGYISVTSFSSLEATLRSLLCA